MALVLRAKRVAFMAAGTDGKLTRMTKFTAMTPAKNPKEYTRQYVDESTETSDVIGYAPSIEYSFDLHTDNAVHEALAAISDGELLGSDTHVEIVTVLFIRLTQSCTIFSEFEARNLAASLYFDFPNSAIFFLLTHSHNNGKYILNPQKAKSNIIWGVGSLFH